MLDWGDIKCLTEQSPHSALRPGAVAPRISGAAPEGISLICAPGCRPRHHEACASRAPRNPRWDLVRRISTPGVAVRAVPRAAVLFRLDRPQGGLPPRPRGDKGQHSACAKQQGEEVLQDHRKGLPDGGGRYSGHRLGNLRACRTADDTNGRIGLRAEDEIAQHCDPQA